jgi:hypothetical protein
MRRRAHALRADRVDDRAKSLRFRFAANRRDLFVGERLLTAGAEARRCEKFNNVGALRFESTHERAQRIDRETLVVELDDRRQQARPRDLPTIHRVAQIEVFASANALNRREPSHQRRPQISRLRERLLRRRV